jgi:hypothetical protein
VTSPAAVRAQRATSPVIAIRGLIGHGFDKLGFGRAATIADMRRIGVSAVIHRMRGVVLLSSGADRI